MDETTPPPRGDTRADGTPTADDELSQAQAQRDEYLEQPQRSRAALVNYQMRSKSQADADRQYAIASLARDLLDGLDNLERAAEALRASANPSVGEGLELVHKQLLATLAKHGVQPIDALGQPFDP